MALDQSNQLWIWGGTLTEEQRAQMERENVAETFAETSQHQHNIAPMRVKWFPSQDLEVVKVDCGVKFIVVMTKDKAGNLALYGIQLGIDVSLDRFFGRGCTEVQGNTIYKLKVEEALLKDFACSDVSTYILMEAGAKERNLWHFHQVNSQHNQW